MSYNKRTISRPKFIILISLFIAFFYNFFALPVKLSINTNLPTLNMFRYSLADLLLTTAVVMLFLFIFSLSKFLLKFWASFFVLMSAILSFYVFNYKIFIEETLVGAIMEADIDEAKGIFSLWIFPWFIVFGLYPFYIINWKVKFKKYNRDFITNITNYIKDLAIPFILFWLILASSYFLHKKMYEHRRIIKNSLSFYMPMNYVAALYQYFYALYELRGIELVDISQKYNFVFTDEKYKDSSYNIVLVIGESARADHQSLNGYNRNTNPELTKVNNLVSYSNVHSCGTLSRISVNCILAPKSRDTFKLPLEESNLISVFKSLGFSTYFLSSQTMYDTGANSFYLASKDADETVFVNKLRSRVPAGDAIYDGVLLSYIDDALKDKRSNNKKLIVLYLTGSHTPYTQRYPQEFRKFTPDNESGDTSLINAYDNTILYTDWFLKQVITRFSDSKTFMYYVADHGDSLGENGVYLHGRPYNIAPIEQRHVAQFTWASPSMIKFMNGNYKNITSHKNDALSHDNVFHTLMDCFKIDSKIVNKKLSLCNVNK